MERVVWGEGEREDTAREAKRKAGDWERAKWQVRRDEVR